VASDEIQSCTFDATSLTKTREFIVISVITEIWAQFKQEPALMQALRRKTNDF